MQTIEYLRKCFNNFFKRIIHSPASNSLDDIAISADIYKNNWLQGHIFQTESHPEISRILKIDLDDLDACIVVTQSCNIIHHDLLIEPHVDILIASRIVGEPDGTYVGSRNPREQHFYILEDENRIPYKVLASKKYCLPRQLLARMYPSNKKIDDLNSLIRWLSDRYNRIAFPDNFSNRIRNTTKVLDKLKDEFKKLVHVSHVFISLSNWDEISVTQPYYVELVFVMPVIQFEDADLRSKTEQTALSIFSQLNNCLGIMIINYEVKSEDEFTLNDVRQMKLWNDFNYFSYSNNKPHAKPI